jgi:hypothetical protein
MMIMTRHDRPVKLTRMIDDRSILMPHFCWQHNVEPQCIRMLGSTMKSHVEGIARQEKYIHTPPTTSYATRYRQSTQTIR